MGKMVSGVLLSVVLIIFASGAVAFYTIFFRPEGEVTVPPLRESSVVDAVAVAEKMGLAVQIEQVESSLPEGRVLAQSPEAGVRIRKGQVVVLQVSKSGELHAVPDVRGQTLAQAQAVIKEQGFMLGDVVRVPMTVSFPVGSGGQPGGAVIAQSPASPANISVTRKIDLLVREGGEGGDKVTIPDVNRMPEKEARALLEASGLKVQAIDSVYSPVMPEGLAIETRPGAGTAVSAGDGVRLKIATQRRPAGFEGTPAPDGNGNVRRVTSPSGSGTEQPEQKPAQGTGSGKTPGSVTVSVPGQGDIFIGDGTPATDKPIREADPNVSVIDQERQRPRGLGTTPAPQQPAPSRPSPAPSAGGGNKVARIRYQVPPLTSPLNLRIELTDPSGRRDVLNRPARSGESVSVEAPYSQECVVSIYLGGDFVWQEKHR